MVIRDEYFTKPFKQMMEFGDAVTKQFLKFAYNEWLKGNKTVAIITPIAIGQNEVMMRSFFIATEDTSELEKAFKGQYKVYFTHDITEEMWQQALHKTEK